VKNTRYLKVTLHTMFLLLLSFILLRADDAIARERKDLILVLDTSLSMAGYGGKNIFSTVKGSLNKFIEQLDDGDSMSFITFDEEVKLYPTVLVESKNDKDILKKYISMTEAKGKWTYTYEMIAAVLKKAQEMEQKDKGRQRVIVVLTDGIDDPPPGTKKKYFNMKDIASGYTGKDWFIYFVNLGQLKNNPKFAKVQKELSESVSKHTKVVDVAGKTPEKAIEKELMRDVKADIEKERMNFFKSPYFYALLAVIALIVIILLLRRIMQVKITGRLVYWDISLMDPSVRSYDLTKHNARDLVVGHGSGCALNIRDINIPEPFRIFARREHGEVRIMLQAGKGYTLEFVKAEPHEYLVDGDIFKAGNYSFRYNRK